MTLSYLILFILATTGMTQILVWGMIFKNIRPEHHFFSCPQCIGFHAGWIMFVIFWLAGIKLLPNPFFGAVVAGFVGACVSYIIDMLVGDDGLNVKFGKD